MTLTTKQIKQILEGAPYKSGCPGSAEVDGDGDCVGYTDEYSNHHLTDLRAILEKEQENETLRQRVEELEAQQSENMDDFLNALEQGILIGSTEDRIRHLLSEVAARAVEGFADKFELCTPYNWYLHAKEYAVRLRKGEDDE